VYLPVVTRNGKDFLAIDERSEQPRRKISRCARRVPRLPALAGTDGEEEDKDGEVGGGTEGLVSSTRAAQQRESKQ
jgi:hypothetical protein